MRELDVVALTVDLPESGLACGDRGAIVHIHGDGEAFLVEFVAPDGRTIALLTLRPDQIRPIDEQGIETVGSDCTAFFYPDPESIGADGTLRIPASWYEDCSHSSGLIEVEPDDPEYPLWRWIIEHHERFGRIEGGDWDRIRGEFARSAH